jgi:spoIIIJ-associated protein
MALALAERVKTTRNAQSTRPLSAYQRRIVHLTLEDDEAVQTHSKGEGAQRRVVIQPRRVAGRGKESGSTSIEELRQQTADRQFSPTGSAGENGGGSTPAPHYAAVLSAQDDPAAEAGLLSRAAAGPPESKE